MDSVFKVERRDLFRNVGASAVVFGASMAVSGCATSGTGGDASATRSGTVSAKAGARELFGRIRRSAGEPRGLIIATHGGGYTSKYFDADGSSAMELISQSGYNVVALDRPGYGSNADWILGFDEQSKVLAEAYQDLNRRYGVPGRKPFLYGHSIGGMLSLLIANASPASCLGVSMTGAGAVYHERAFAGLKARFASPDTSSHSMSGEAARVAVYMGPAGGFDPAVARLDPQRDVPSLVQDLKDALDWPQRLPVEASKATVPVHLVMPEFDGLWRSDVPGEQSVRALFSQVPFAEVYVQRFAGHSVELQYVARAHVLKILAFADECQQAGGRNSRY